MGGDISGLSDTSAPLPTEPGDEAGGLPGSMSEPGTASPTPPPA